MSKLFASVIIPVYDAPKSLRLVLEGYRRQSCKNFELIIADDGSPIEMKTIVQEFAKTAPFKVKYLWQEDKGFRKAKAANEGVKISEGDWLIFSDGDCIPHKDFVKVHLKSAKPNSFCGGIFIAIPLRYSIILTPQMVRDGYHEKFMPLRRIWRFKFRRIREIIAGRNHYKSPISLGSNTSCDRNTFYAINGFDEDFRNMSGEDSDLGMRLYRYGASYTEVWHSAFVFHLDHAIDENRLSHPKRDWPRSKQYLVRPVIPTRCENGLSKEGKYTSISNYDLPHIGF